MDWDAAVVPLTVAAVGAVAVAIGGWMAARSSLRGRLIDMMRDNEQERRAFQVRVVRAVNDLTLASTHLNRERLSALRRLVEEARSQAETLSDSGSVSFTFTTANLSPKADARAAAATDAWRSVFAEAQVFASGETYGALEAFDFQRGELVDAVNAAMRQPDLLASIVKMEAADELCNELSNSFAVNVYRQLQIEMLKGGARIFYLGHVMRLRRFAKETDGLHRQGIRIIEERIAQSAAASVPPSSDGDH